jgi:hypothetical protein
MKQEVYFSSIENRNREECFTTLLERLDTELSQYKEGAFIGIKMTIGDEKSVGYIKPEIVRILVERLKRQGAKPFVFDTNVIYSGQRQNAIDHLNLAYHKGFTPDRLGCPYIIADGVFGTDSRSIKAEFGNVKEVKVPSLVKVLDDLIVLTHITGHMMSGFAGSIKNVAMGMASRAGKQIQHSSLKPVINVKHCTLCGCCMEICPASAISERSGKAFINLNLCVGCCECIACCKFNAVKINWREDANVFVEKMTEYACAILQEIKRKLFINFATDITEECDCLAGDDPRIVKDMGIFASDNILAVDKACFDMLTKNQDVFSRDGKIKIHLHMFKYAEKIRLGKLDYRLIKV